MICERCNSDHDGKYGSGRFCGEKCARGFATQKNRQEISDRVSLKLRKSELTISHSEKINTKLCFRCKCIKPFHEFYPRRYKDKIKISAYCKVCTVNESMERQRRFKRLCLEYKGNKCSICGYDKCEIALDFHHVDPTKKEHTIAGLRSYTFTDKVKVELDKTILVCSNCHRELHYKVRAPLG